MPAGWLFCTGLHLQRVFAACSFKPAQLGRGSGACSLEAAQLYTCGSCTCTHFLALALSPAYCTAFEGYFCSSESHSLFMPTRASLVGTF